MLSNCAWTDSSKGSTDTLSNLALAFVGLCKLGDETPELCLLVSYRPLATRSLNAWEALEAAPRGDTPSDCLISCGLAAGKTLASKICTPVCPERLKAVAQSPFGQIKKQKWA